MDFDAMIGDDSWLQDSPPRFTEPVSKPLNKRSKALNIDDLLKDHYTDKSKNLNHGKKRLRTFVSDSEESDDEECGQKTQKEVKFEQLVETCEKQVHGGGATVEVLKWGEQMFVGQKERKASVCLSAENPVVQALSAARGSIRESCVSEGDEQTAENLLLELLASGWFLLFHVKADKELMSWILHTMMFTTEKDVERAACEFLCHELESETMDYSSMPCYKSIVETLDAYGYVGPQTSNMKGTEDNSDSKAGPPHNLGSFLRLLASLAKTRHVHHICSTDDLEELAVLISSLLLDRSLLQYSLLVVECLVAILNSFTEEEWMDSCKRIALHMTKYDRQMVNCLKLTRSLHSREVRMRSLQSLVALHFFAKLTNEEAIADAWNLLSVFRKTDVKRDVVDFMSLYHQMSLADMWLWSNPAFESDAGALESWLHFLKSCSFQISSTDWRPYATKVRNQASYLLQEYQCYYQCDDYGQP